MSLPCFSKTEGKRVAFLNPGCLEYLHQRTTDITPKFFDGISIDITRIHSLHGLFKSKIGVSEVFGKRLQIGGTYAFKLSDNLLKTPEFEVDFNTSALTFKTGVSYNVTDRVKTQLIVRMNPNNYDYDGATSLQYSGDESCTTIDIYKSKNKDLIADLSILKALSKNWTFGGQLELRKNDENWGVYPIIAGRYSNSNFCIAATVSKWNNIVTASHKLCQGIFVGSSIDIDRVIPKSQMSIFMKYAIRPDIEFRCMGSSTFNVGMDCKMYFDGCHLVINGLYSVKKGTLSLGIGYNQNTGPNDQHSIFCKF